MSAWRRNRCGAQKARRRHVNVGRLLIRKSGNFSRGTKVGRAHPSGASTRPAPPVSPRTIFTGIRSCFYNYTTRKYIRPRTSVTDIKTARVTIKYGVCGKRFLCGAVTGIRITWDTSPRKNTRSRRRCYVISTNGRALLTGRREP